MTTTQPDTADLSGIYRRSRLRLTELAASLDDPKAIVVPACPGWSAHDVLSHLVAVGEDVLAGRLTGPPTDEETTEQVHRRAAASTVQVLQDWEKVGPRVEEVLSQVPVWPLAVDALSHEHDVRGGAGLPGHRDDPDVTTVAAALLGRFRVPAPLTVRCGEQTFDCADADAAQGPELELVTDPFEAFRFRMGRRSRRQLTAMCWRGDPSPVLEQLTVFGPSPEDIIE